VEMPLSSTIVDADTIELIGLSECMNVCLV
jgi:hypothetical protein